jgi:pimeloyl-ACP methyl ester carboxylesterase
VLNLSPVSAGGHDFLELPSGERLALDVVPPGPEATTAVYVHGLGSHRGGEKALFLERELTARGFGFARFDLRGHGDSDGKLEDLTLARQLEDLRAVLARLGSGAAGPPPAKLLLIGSSLGALTVAWHTALAAAAPKPAATAPALPILGQVLIAPAFRIVDRLLAALGDDGRERWRREGKWRFVGPWFQFDLSFEVVLENERFPLERLRRETRLPTLILHGTRDESAPFRLSEEFVAPDAGRDGRMARLVAVEGGDHRLTAHKGRLLEEILRFVAATRAGEFRCAS